MTALLSDLRYGIRMLRKSPLLSSVSVLTMALGIGLTVFTFSMVYGSVLRGIPVPDDERLITVQMDNPSRGVNLTLPSFADMVAYRDRAHSFEHLGALDLGTVNLASEGLPPERYAGGFVTGDLLTDLGVPPHLGRTFRAEEDDPDAPASILLSFHVWQNRFGGDPAILGLSVRANGEQAEVVGIMPEGFRFPFNQDVWLPLRMDPDGRPRRDQLVQIVGRVRPGVSFATATDELRLLAEQIEAEESNGAQGYRPIVRLFEHVYMPPQITAVMYLMLASVFGVLLIACANVANLLLARATVRGKEVAIRTALGASRLRVVRQLLVETFLLALGGGLLGLASAQLMGQAWIATMADIQKPYWIDMRIDTASLLLTAVVIVLTAVVAGTVPALRSTGRGVAAILQDEGRGASSLRLGRLSGALVIGEIAISCALLVSAGLMIKSIVRVNTVELGFRTDNIITGRVGLFETDYPERVARDRFFAQLVEGVREEAGVRSAALTSSLPGTEPSTWWIGIEGQAYDSDADYPVVTGSIIGTDYFRTFDVKLLQGRELDAAEMGADAEPVAIVNDSFARRFFGNTPALGSRVRLGRSQSTNPWMRIIGVVPDLHVAGGVGGIESDRLPREQVYVSQGVLDIRFLTIAVHSDQPPGDVVDRLRAVVARLDPNLPVYGIRTMPQALDEHTWAFRIFGQLFTMLGGAALFLASVGLYGVMAFSVSSRSQELGIRMALGASGRNLLMLVLRKGAAQLAIGLALGLTVGALLAQPLRVITYGVEASDPTVYVAIIVTLVATGTLATLLPARRATRVDPNVALRAE